ncbi:aldo-keto reductase family 1 member B1-like [Macrosteles quadrilineatus]|uniref:aldo-keto reductase family 1 member B1-like n=1 Tax=Macrosteles quadrilineatus TaxID=74068 RepID=UPI0023E2A83C|nr:aldo-keto reductase family 1 member B1-like [Macrosteles quadrilineatus]
MTSTIPLVKLNNGKYIPALGLGTFKIAHLTEEIVGQAIDQGYRLIDTAPVYQNNEVAVGRAIRQKIREGVVTREEMFVVSKLWNTHHSKGEVTAACEKSLRFLSVDYIDLYLINWPFGLKSNTRDHFKKQEFYAFDTTSIEDTWKEMETLVSRGLVRSVGVANFNTGQLERILKIAKYKPVVNQIETNVRLVQEEILQFCKARDIVVMGYRPLGAPGRKIELTPEEEWQVVIESNHNLIEIGKKYKKTPAQVCLRYLVELGVVPIPKTAEEARLKENMDIFDFKLDVEDTKYIQTLHTNYRITHYEAAKAHKEYPFK